MSLDSCWIKSLVLGFKDKDYRGIQNKELREMIFKKRQEVKAYHDHYGRDWFRMYAFLNVERDGKKRCMRVSYSVCDNDVVLRGGSLTLEPVLIWNTAGVAVREDAVEEALKYRRGKVLKNVGDCFLNSVSFCSVCGEWDADPIPDRENDLRSISWNGQMVKFDFGIYDELKTCIGPFTIFSRHCPSCQSKKDKAEEKQKATEQRKAAQKVYVISSGDAVKIGISNNPEKRLQSLQTSNPNKLSLEACFDAEDAQMVEWKSHLALRANRLAGEWFSVSAERAIATVNFILGKTTDPGATLGIFPEKAVDTR